MKLSHSTTEVVVLYLIVGVLSGLLAGAWLIWLFNYS